MSDCDHDDLVTLRGGRSRFWACGNCSLRFYPACRKCVTVGHRNGHDEEWRATLDTARLPVSDGLREAAQELLSMATSGAAKDHLGGAGIPGCSNLRAHAELVDYCHDHIDTKRAAAIVVDYHELYLRRATWAAAILDHYDLDDGATPEDVFRAALARTVMPREGRK